MRRATRLTVTLVGAYLAATGTARADVPRGDLSLHGTLHVAGKPDQELAGALSIDSAADGSVRVIRCVSAPAAFAGNWEGTGRVEGDALSVTLVAQAGITDALAATTSGVKERSVLAATYSLAPDGSLRASLSSDGWSADEVASVPQAVAGPGSHLSKRAYFSALDRDPAFQTLAKKDALAALLDLVGRADVPPAVDAAYAKKAGSAGGGRILMALDYTRGMDDTPPWSVAIKGGLKHAITTEVLTPMLTHFRGIDGVSIFQGDAGFVRPFRDSPLTSDTSDQTGHMLCALETGVRLGTYEKHPIERKIYELGLRVANAVMGLKGVKPTIADWSRAGIIGHEMIGDEDGSGFIGQMNAYARLVANGDPDHVRDHWDRAVAAVQAGDHLTAWQNIRAIARAADIPETRAEQAAARANPHPRFAAPGDQRIGNSLEDLGLSVYGFALGHKTAAVGYATPAAARADLEAFLAAGGSEAPAIVAAVDATRASTGK